MLTAEAHIETDRPGRYLIQLCRHADDMSGDRRHGPRTLHGGDTSGRTPQMRHVEWSDSYGIVSLNWGQWTMRATADTLTVRAEAADEENLRRIQDLVGERLERFGRRDHLKVTWHQSQSPE